MSCNAVATNNSTADANQSKQKYSPQLQEMFDNGTITLADTSWIPGFSKLLKSSHSEQEEYLSKGKPYRDAVNYWKKELIG